MATYHVSNAMAGLVTGMTIIGTMIARFSAGILTTKFSARQLTIISMAILVPVLLAYQLQGGLICYAYEHNIPVVSPLPVQWRKILDYKLGAHVKREELKQQSFDYVKSRFGIECSEDEAEAIAIACAMSK